MAFHRITGVPRVPPVLVVLGVEEVRFPLHYVVRTGETPVIR
jgi:hypothetical protein